MGGLDLSRAQRASRLFALLFGALVGCSDLDFREPDQTGGGAMGGHSSGGGAGGSSGRGGASGQSGGAGSSSGGTSGMGGSTFAVALQTCLDWCRNEPAGPSCCDPFMWRDCLRDCHDRCEETVAEQGCIEEWTAARRCELEAECDEFFGECAEPARALTSCEYRYEAQQDGTCASVAHGCALTEEDCLAPFDSADADCMEGWRRYVRCIDRDVHLTCADCAETWLRAEPDCDWPTPHVQVPGSVCSYGYGWNICDFAWGLLTTYHLGGGQSGFRNLVERAPEEDVAVLMLSNGTYDWAQQMAYELYLFYLGY